MSDHPEEPASDTTDPGSGAQPEPGTVGPQPDRHDTPTDVADLERIAADFDGVDAALGRLDDGTYWTDEITGAEIPDEVLAADPVARRADAG